MSAVGEFAPPKLSQFNAVTSFCWVLGTLHVANINIDLLFSSSLDSLLDCLSPFALAVPKALEGSKMANVQYFWG